MPEKFEPSDAELEMVVDEARQKAGQPPARRPSEQGIADMQARLKLLYEQKNQLLKRLGLIPPGAEHQIKTMDAEISEVDREIREADQRLAEFQTQFKSRN